MDTRELVVQLGEFIAPITSSVSSSCRNSSQKYIDEFKKNHRWAVAMYGAGARPQSGLLDGNVNSLGYFEECMNLNEYENVSAQFCSATLKLHSTNTSSLMEEILARKGISWGICLPKNCTILDIKTGFNEWMKDWKIVADSLYCQDSYLPMDALDLLAMFVLIVLAFCVLLSTAYDFYSERSKRREYRKDDFLTSFSIINNGHFLFQKAGEDEIQCLYGIRFLSILWILFGHVIFVASGMPTINTLHVSEMTSHWMVMPIISATLAVDTFLMISGLLVANKFLRRIPRDTPLKKVSLLTIPIVVHRYLRIAPPVALLILLQVSLWRHAGSGPLWVSGISYLVEFCHENWLWALLFIQNYVSGNRMCFGHSWYLNVDMQLFLLSPLIIIPMLYWREWACYLMFACLISSGYTIGFLVNFINEFPPGVMVGDPTKWAPKNQYYYVVTHTRFAPYVIGMVVGYFLHKHKATERIFRTFQIDKQILLWTLAAASIIYGIFGITPFQSPHYVYEPFGASIFTAAVPIIWTMGVAMIVLGCELKLWPFLERMLSTPKFHALSRLTYCIYLVHLPIMNLRASTRRAPVYITTTDMVVDFFGDCILSILFAVLLYFAVEGPFINFGYIMSDWLAVKMGGLPKETTEEPGTSGEAPRARTSVREVASPRSSIGSAEAGPVRSAAADIITSAAEVVVVRQPEANGGVTEQAPLLVDEPLTPLATPEVSRQSTGAEHKESEKSAEEGETHVHI